MVWACRNLKFTSRNHRREERKYPLFATVLAAVLVLSGCGGSSKPKGFLNTATLEASIAEQLNEKVDTATGAERTDLQDEGIHLGDHVSETVCILKPNSKREFTCKVAIGSDSENTDVLVSKDGERWVTE